jgi:hypothetical protein
VFDTETVEVVWSKTFREFAEPLLGRKWNLHEGEDYPSQNSFVKITVPDEMWTESEDWEGDDDMDFQRWLDGGEYCTSLDLEPGCGRVMQWLYDQGHVPANTYGVDISW